MILSVKRRLGEGECGSSTTTITTTTLRGVLALHHRTLLAWLSEKILEFIGGYMYISYPSQLVTLDAMKRLRAEKNKNKNKNARLAYIHLSVKKQISNFPPLCIWLVGSYSLQKTYGCMSLIRIRCALRRMSQLGEAEEYVTIGILSDFSPCS
jgi:hypothetical protein